MGSGLAYRSHPVASRAVDWLSVGFQARTERSVDDLLDLAWVLAELSCPGEDWGEPCGSQHFGEKRVHPGGVAVSHTVLESAAGGLDGRSTAGTGLIELSGRFWGSVTGLTRQQVLTQVRRHPGFRRCTRMDVQQTTLNPDPSAQEIAHLVEQQKLWAKGFHRSMVYVERDPRQQMASEATIYLGTKKSAKRIRIYDKAAESGWEVPARRVELQARAEYADNHFRWLAQICENEPFPEEALVTAESNGVGAILAKECDLRDTSAWVDRDLPKNWLQAAPTPGWWKEACASPVSPEKVSFQPPADLAASVAAMVTQYGRKGALEAMRQAVVMGTDFGTEILLIGLRMAQRLRREDLEVLLAVLPPECHADARALYHAVLADAAEYTEQELDEG